MKRLVVASGVLLALRLYAATAVGFGDSEALYAAWAAHPQPAYLDHPGLVGAFARLLGGGGIPTPVRAHVVTAIVATLVPWLVVLAAGALGAAKERALLAGFVVALVPETAVGLFALTPDLLLAPAWLGAIALAGLGLRAPPGSPRAAMALLGAGLLAGIAASAKVSGLLLFAALLATYAFVARSAYPEARAARSVWPWAGLLAGVVVVLPIAAYETRLGFPMLRHRLVDSQAGAGLAARNVIALVGGQLVYVSPVFAWLAVVVARDLWRARGRDAMHVLLFATFAIPVVPLVALCLWSNVAEPHWIAPALLALPISAVLASTSTSSRRVIVAACAIAGAFTLVAHAWVLTPLSSMLMPASADPRADISVELYGWPRAIAEAREQLRLAATPFDPEGHDAAVVGPHWTVCAQLAAAMPDVRVGCATPIDDDFDRWFPRDEWRRADFVLWVTDTRFPDDGAAQLPMHTRVSDARVRILRGGRVVRTFSLTLYSRRGAG